MSQAFLGTRTGCLTCRRRKRKCDEAKPHCRACQRNKLDCLWPPHIRRRFNLDDHQEVTPDTHPQELVIVTTGSTTTLPESASPILAGRTSPRSTNSIEPDDVVWYWGLSTFLGQRRAGTLLPASQVLLSYYSIEFTAPKLARLPMCRLFRGSCPSPVMMV